MSGTTRNELWEMAATLADADSEDHEDDEIIQPIFDMLNKLSDAQKKTFVSLTTPKARDDFKETIKKICTGNLSYDQLEQLGIEDILVDKTDPAGIVYKIVVASWEGEGGL